MGWQDGEKRNERIKKTFEPVNMLTHHWLIGDKSKLTTTLSYQFGEESGSRLDWFNANNPSPVYYRNMPSFTAFNGGSQDPADVANEINAWKSNAQLNWGSLYQANRNVDGNHAAYWVTSDVNKDKIASIYSNFRTELTDHIDLVVSASYQKTKSELFRRVEDLLGADHVLNYDDFNTTKNLEVNRYLMYDLKNPDYVARKGDRYEYNYEINRDYADLYFQSKIKGKKLDVTLGMKAAMTKFYREGKYHNEMYINDSYGKSKTYDFIDFGVKSQFLYKIDGRNFIQLNAMFQTDAPSSDEIFPNARMNDVTVDGVKSAQIYTGDLSYILRAPRVKARATAYYTRTKDEIEKSFGYIDGISTSQRLFVSEVITGVGKEYLGTELAIEAQVTPTITVSAVAAIGQNIYKDNADYNLYSDNYVEEGLAYKNFGEAYIKNYKVASGPQAGFTLGLEYRDPKFWWIGVSGNFLANNYIDIAPYRRTKGFLSDDQGMPIATVTEEGLKEVLKQQKMDDQFMLNINIGKTIRLGKYSAGISGSINNVLNNKEYITGGFEQMRIGNYNNAINKDYQKLFGPKLWYGQGTTFFANVYFRF